MKDYFRKGLSGLVLGTYLATGGYIRASEGAPDRIDINHADSIEVLFEQPRYFQVGRKILNCGKTYLIDKDSHIDKPEVALSSILEYFNKIESNYKSVEGRRKIEDAIGKTNHLLTEETGNYNPITKTRSSGRQLTDAGMAKFKEAASDGMITPKEYEQLGNGDVYVAERVGSKIEAQGRLDQGIIVRVDHSRDDCYEPSVVARKLPQAPPVDRREPTVKQPAPVYQPVPQPTPVPEQPGRLEETVQEYKPSQETKGIVEEELKDKWGKRHPIAKKVLIGTGIAVGLAAALIGLQKEEDKPSNRITGGPPY